jgi:hypothetical protein
MKKVWVLSLAVVGLLMFTACSPKSSVASQKASNPPQTSQESTAAPTGQVNTSAPETQATTAAPVKAIVSLDYATEELLSKAYAFDEFGDTNSEYQVKAVFTANIVVREFKYVELRYSDTPSDNDAFSFHIDKVLYSADELSPEKPLVVTMLLDGAIPNRGISYMDENGTTRCFTISMSGKDDSLLLTEFS